MKRLIRWWAPVAAVILTLPTLVLAKSHSIESIHSTVRVQTNGAVDVEETITYTFRGDYSFAYRDIELKPGEQIRNVSVREGTRAYTQRSGQVPGTFTISGGNPVRVTWHYDARNETRTFEFSYTVDNVVKRYEDVADIYFQFVGDGWDRRIGTVSASVELPAEFETTDIRAWAHGPLHGTVRIASGSRVQYDIAPMPGRMYFEGRIVVPADPFAQVPLAVSVERLPAIMAQEKAWAEEANRLREAAIAHRQARAERRARNQARADRFLPIAIALGVIALGLWFRHQRTVARPHRVHGVAARGEIPSDHPPAIVSYIMYGQVTGPALVATLLDLSNRGYFEIKESIERRRTFFGGTKEVKDFTFTLTRDGMSDLEPFEADLIEFLMTRAGDGRSFTMSGLKKTASNERSAFRKWFRQWMKGVMETGQKLDLYEPYPRGVVAMNLLTGAVVLAAGIVMSVLSDSPAGVPAIIGGVLTMVFTVFLRRRTPEGQRLVEGWRGFRDHLKRISKAMGPVSLTSSDWGRYLGVAIIFGMHEKLVPNLRLKEGPAGSGFPAWYVPAMMGSGGENSVAGLASGFSSMVSSVSTTMSSASGAGGGASVGGGGGSGGGGGGAG